MWRATDDYNDTMSPGQYHTCAKGSNFNSAVINKISNFHEIAPNITYSQKQTNCFYPINLMAVVCKDSTFSFLPVVSHLSFHLFDCVFVFVFCLFVCLCVCVWGCVCVCVCVVFVFVFCFLFFVLSINMFSSLHAAHPWQKYNWQIINMSVMTFCLAWKREAL